MHQRHRFGDGDAVLGRASLIEHLHRESVQVAGRDGTFDPTGHTGRRGGDEHDQSVSRWPAPERPRQALRRWLGIHLYQATLRP